MGNWQWLLDLVVAALLAATLLRARRLDHALAALRHDRGALEQLLGGFDTNAQQARDAIVKLRELTEGAGRRIEQQTAAGIALQDDLVLLVERGERLAERLDHALRAARTGFPAAATPKPAALPAAAAAWLDLASPPETATTQSPAGDRERAGAGAGSGAGETRRVRSKAERDLLLALAGR